MFQVYYTTSYRPELQNLFQSIGNPCTNYKCNLLFIENYYSLPWLKLRVHHPQLQVLGPWVLLVVLVCQVGLLKICTRIRVPSTTSLLITQEVETYTGSLSLTKHCTVYHDSRSVLNRHTVNLHITNGINQTSQQSEIMACFTEFYSTLIFHQHAHQCTLYTSYTTIKDVPHINATLCSIT